jgi:hypothetical protein
MKHWFNQNYKTLIIAAFLIPIITVAIVSISHVTKWYGISNPVSWAIYLSIGIEIAALSALAAISANMGKKVYFPFAVVTIIQFIGNIFFAYTYIDVNGQSFKDWVGLVSPLVEFMGVDANDFVGHKRFLAFFAGGMLPIISLSFLHMLVKFTEEDRLNEDKIIVDTKESNPEELKDFVDESSRIHLSDDDLKKLEEVLLNPPAPNEKLKEAAQRYSDEVKEKHTHIDDFDVNQKWDGISQEVWDRMEAIEKQRESIHGPITEEDLPPTGAYANSEYRKRGELLAEIIKNDEELGLYEEPFDNPLIKEDVVNETPITGEETQIVFKERNIEPSTTPQTPSEMMLTTNDDIINSIPSDDDVSNWDVTLMDGLEDEEPFFTEEEIEKILQEEPTEEEIQRNFSTITPEPTNFFQKDEFVPSMSDEEIMEMNQDEYERKLDVEDEFDGFVPEPFATPEEVVEFKIDEIVETSSENEDEKKN